MIVFQSILESLSPFLKVAVLLLLIGGLIWVYIATHENSGFRGVWTYLGHVLIAVLGWLVGRWAGLFMISLPVLIFYYYLLFHLAMVVVPVSDPDSLREWQLRFLIFVRYQWGVQYPHWMVTDTTGDKIEKRIPGDQFGSAAPGLIWARSHQVVGLTTGLSFSRVPNSGTVFTRRYESPIAVVDLRTQMRTTRIEVISSDGIPFRALLFTAFQVDNEKWSREQYHHLVRQNPLLENAQTPDYTRGSYPFSRSRLRALFATIGVSSHVEEHEEARIAKWDERTLYQIEKTAREALSQRRLNQLWQPKADGDRCSAMDEIAEEIKRACSTELHQRGIRLHTCRIVNLEFPGRVNLDDQHASGKSSMSLMQLKSQAEPDSARDRSIPKGSEEAEVAGQDQIVQKQIVAWSADWQKEAAQTRADGKAQADLLMQEARAFAYTNLLTAFAEGLEEARLLDPQLPHYVIAIRFIGALEKLIGQQPEAQGMSEARNSLEQLKKMIPWDGD